MAWEQSPTAARYEFATLVTNIAHDNELPEDDGPACQAFRRAIGRLETTDDDGDPLEEILNDLERELHALGTEDERTEDLYGDVFALVEQLG